MSGQKEHMIKALEKGIRYDGRKPDQYRDISIEADISVSAEGSARVKIGDTEVLAGVKFELGKPFDDKPDEGSIMVNAELIPMSSPEFEPGPPGIEAIEVARVTDRAIRESGTIDFKKLCVTSGEQVWIVIIDVVIINHAGNLFDAAALGAYAALQHTFFPEIADGKVDYKHKSDRKIELEKMPISTTIYKLGKAIIVDPTIQEQEYADARLTIATLEDGKICAMQKGGSAPLSAPEVEQMVDLAFEKSEELRAKLKA